MRGVADPPGLRDAYATVLEIEIEGAGTAVAITRIALPCDDKPGDPDALVLMAGGLDSTEPSPQELLRLPIRPAGGESLAAYVYAGQAVTVPTGRLRLVAPVDSAWMRLGSRRKLPRQLELTLVRADSGETLALDLRTVKRPRGTDPERVSNEPVDSLLAGVPALVKGADGRLRLPAGGYHLDHDLVVPRGATVVVSAGTTLLLAPGRNIYAYGRLELLGSAASPIVIAPLGRGPWATIALLGADSRGSRFEHVRFIGGSQGLAGTLDLNGTVSVIDSGATFVGCRFERLRGEDAVHAERSEVTIDTSAFVDVVSDGLDLVQATATVRDSRFDRVGDDALDAGHDSRLQVERVFVQGARGKGVSTGQGSQATVAESVFVGCGRGVSAFDGSTVVVARSAIVRSVRAGAQAAGQKSGEAGRVRLERCLLWENGSEGSRERVELVGCRSDYPVDLAAYKPALSVDGASIGPAVLPKAAPEPPPFTAPTGTAPLFTGATSAMGGAPPLPRTVWLQMLLGTLAAVAVLLLLERRLRKGRS